MKDNGEAKHLTVTFSSQDGKHGNLRVTGNLEDRKAVLVLAEALKLIASIQRGTVPTGATEATRSKTIDVPYRPGRIA